jgi:hypothetical protein
MLTPAFDQAVHSYTILVDDFPAHFNLTVTSPFASFTVDNKAATSSQAVSLTVSQNGTVVTVQADKGAAYSLVVIKPSLPVPPARLTVTGRAIEIRPFGEGALAYSNREYVFAGVPIVLRSGFNFTMIPGGADNVTILASAHQRGSVVAITSEAAAYMADDWTQILSSGFHYTDGGQTSLSAFYKVAEANQQLSIKQGGWAGSFLLIPLGIPSSMAWVNLGQSGQRP